MKKKYLIPAVLVAACSTLALGACGGQNSGSSATPTPSATTAASQAPSAPQTIDSAVGDGQGLKAIVQQAQSELAKVKEQSADMYSDITIDTRGDNTIIYTYTYKTSVTDVAAAKQQLESERSTLQQSCDSLVFPTMRKAGITNPTIVYTWLNSDGSTVDSMTFTDQSGK